MNGTSRAIKIREGKVHSFFFLTLRHLSCPRLSMGWYHALNILDGNVPSANLSDVVSAVRARSSLWEHTLADPSPWRGRPTLSPQVEPYFLGAGKDTDGGVAFAAFAAANPAVNFCPSLEAMPSAAEGAKKARARASVSERCTSHSRRLTGLCAVAGVSRWLSSPDAPLTTPPC